MRYFLKMCSDKILRFEKRLRLLNEELMKELDSLGSEITPFYRDPKNIQEILDIYERLSYPRYRKLKKYFESKKEFLEMNPRVRYEYFQIIHLYVCKYPHIDSDTDDDEE